MSEKNKKIAKALESGLSGKAAKTMIICSCVMLLSVLMHDGDHIRQAINWGYSIPLSLWVLNLTVYILPVISIFLSKLNRFSSTIVTAVAGVFTSASFLILHLCGSASGLWGVWNYSYFELIKGVTYNGVFYQGVDWISWVFLFEVPVLSLPGTFIALREYRRARRVREAHA